MGVLRDNRRLVIECTVPIRRRSLLSSSTNAATKRTRVGAAPHLRADRFRAGAFRPRRHPPDQRRSFQNPKVMDTMFQLTDVYGPRLTNSPQFRAAGDWAVKQLKEFGLDNVKLEKWGPFGRGWAYTSYTGYIKDPQYQPLIGYPLAWTPAPRPAHRRSRARAHSHRSRPRTIQRQAARQNGAARRPAQSRAAHRSPPAAA